MVYSKERYQRLKAAHICVSCGREAFGKFTRCAECLEKNYLNSNKDKEKIRQNCRELRARKKELGQCKMCKESICEESTVYCKKHFLWVKNYQIKYRTHHFMHSMIGDKSKNGKPIYF